MADVIGQIELFQITMSKLNFVTFGVQLDNRLLLRASRALAELYSFGDLELRSAWLYYGNVASASMEFRVSATKFRTAIERRERRLSWKLQRFTEMSEDELDLILDGSQMMMEMSNAERDALFPPNARPAMTKENFITKIERWRRTKDEQWLPGDGFRNLPITSAVKLLENYAIAKQTLLEDIEAHSEGW